MRFANINESSEGYEVSISDVTRENFGSNTTRKYECENLKDALYIMEKFLRTGFITYPDKEELTIRATEETEEAEVITVEVEENNENESSKTTE